MSSKSLNTQPLQAQSAEKNSPVRKMPMRRSRKAPALKADVITRRVQGQSKRSIARDLHITANTVDVILRESQIDAHLESGQRVSVTLIPEALRVVKHRLEHNSENMAIKLLENTCWPLQQKAGKAPDNGVVLAIQNLMGNVQVNSETITSPSIRAKGESKAEIDVSPLPTTQVG